MKFTPQYSGKRSHKIWNAINSIPRRSSWGDLYACFVLLQNMEETYLDWLNQARKVRTK